VVSNVTNPTLLVYRPPAGVRSRTAAVICPGGGFMALSIKSEGTDVAQWLTRRGVTAFVLKYRLAHTGEDATAEFAAMFADRAKFATILRTIVPLSVADGLAALTYVRKHAGDWDIDPARVGIVGFSAGGEVAAVAAFRYTPENRPAFVAPIYPGTFATRDLEVPGDAPPMFLAAATDDQLGLAMDSVRLYTKWTEAHKSAELHMYSKGGHGFGMRKQGFPSDTWIDRFGDWLQLQGFITR